MAFDAITTAELAVGKPITNELLEKFRNRDEFLNAQIGTLDSLTISNPSFEVTDTAVVGGAGNWVFTPFTGGGATLDTSTSVHGSQSVLITHPGGAGNGGGYYESDFYAVSTLSGYTFEWAQNAKGGAVPAVTVSRYKRGQELIDNTIQLPGSTDVETSGVFEQKSGGFLPSSFITVQSSCAYIKMRLIGGTTDHSTAGTVNFDHVRVIETPNASAGNYVVSNRSAFTFTATATSVQYPILTAKIRESGGYKFYFESTGAANRLLEVLLNGATITTALQVNSLTTYNIEFQSTSILGFTTANVGERSLHRLKAGDEVLIRSAFGTTGSYTFSNLMIGVKDPKYGAASINHLGSTVAT